MPRRQEDFDDEVRAHLEAEERALIAEGVAPAEARARARRAFGNVLATQERFYESRKVQAMIASFFSDVKTGFRQVWNHPGFALLAIATMALAIGANTALFSVVHAVLIKALPYEEPERLARIWMDNRRLQMREDWASWLNYQDYKRLNTTFSSIAAFSNGAASLTGDGEPERVLGVRAESELFRILGVRPIAGRAFTKEEEVDGKNGVWVIGWDLWQRRFGGRTDILGKPIKLDGGEVTVIGVLPPGMRFPLRTTEFWTPLVVSERAKTRVGYWLQMVGKTKPGVTMEAAQRDMQQVGRRLEQDYPKENAGYGIFVNPLENHEVGETRTPLLVLAGAVGCVLLIACVNVAGLMLARAETRGREAALRSALGAGRGRLVLMAIAESLSLALLAGLLGLGIAALGVRVLLASAPPDLPRLNEVHISLPVLVFAFAATLITSLLAGLAPAWRFSRLDLNSTLRDGGRSVAGSRSADRLRAVLIAGECMLAIMLLVGAVLLLRTLGNLRSVDPGFRTDVLTMDVSVSRARRADRAQVVAFYRELFTKLRGLPGVTGVSAVTSLLLSETPNSGTFTLQDRPPFPEAEQIEATVDSVGPGFFELMRVPLRYGRWFNENDGPDTPRVAVINESFAQRYWPGRDPVGQKFVFGIPGERNPWVTIIGVAADMHRRGLHRPARLEVFRAMSQNPSVGAELLLTTAGGISPLSLTPAVRAEVRRLDSLALFERPTTVADKVGGSLEARQFQTILLGLLAALALLLAAVGIFALMLQTVMRRTQEIGVRMALGASSGGVVGMFVRRAMAPALAGIALGIGGAAALSRIVSGLLFGVTPIDPLSYALAAGLLGVLAFLACSLPALWSARVDPMIALRNE